MPFPLPRWPAKLLLLGGVLVLAAFGSQPDPSIAFYIADPRSELITLRWKDGSGKIIGDLGTLKNVVGTEGRTLLFGMNGGMYTTTQGPVGLYIEEGRIINRIDRRTEGQDNFHMQPNGVFGVYADGSAFVKTTAAMEHMREVDYATQSGPMLLTAGRINGHFTPGSRNLHIRNGVGLLPDGRVLFGISREPINFHDFASWFKDQGCTDALYLDGAVSKAYIPEAGMRGMDGALGVLIAVVARP